MSHFDDPAWECDLAFLTGITQHLNNLNQALQGNDMTIARLYSEVHTFQELLDGFIEEFELGNLSNFELCRVAFETHRVTDLTPFAERLKRLKVAFEYRFGDFRAHADAFNIFGNPFNPNLTERCHQRVAGQPSSSAEGVDRDSELLGCPATLCIYIYIDKNI